MRKIALFATLNVYFLILPVILKIVKYFCPFMQISRRFIRIYHNFLPPTRSPSVLSSFFKKRFFLF